MKASKQASITKLFHVSEEGNIALFEPRPPPSPQAGVVGNAVWAIDDAHLPNYLLPRDCPRVTFAATTSTTQEDRARFLPPTASRVVALEEAWRSRVESCELFLYEFAADSFELVDRGAGYYISRRSERPLSVTRKNAVLKELSGRQVEVRFLPNLWELRNAVISSSLEFSIIRFRNAAPPFLSP